MLLNVSPAKVDKMLEHYCF